jgi:hypothetical protein
MMQAPKERKQRAIKSEQPYREEGLRLAAFRNVVTGLHWKPYAENVYLDAHPYRQDENGINRIYVENALVLRQKYGITLDYTYAGDDSAFDAITVAKIRAWLKCAAGNGAEVTDEATS